MEKKRIEPQKKRQIPTSLKIGLLLLAVVVLFNSYTLAKYFMEEDREELYVAKNFYFESDLLSVATGAIPHYTLKAGEDTISFDLMNYPDALRSSEVDISYTVVLTKDGAEKKSTSGTIAVGQNSVSVSFDGLDAGTYVVTATATGPYTQTLQGRFTVVGADYGLSYSVNDAAGSPNIKVTVTTTDYFGNIVISWPGSVLPDNTDPLLQNATEGSHTIEVKAQSEYTFQFFKTNPNENYSSHITVAKANS